MPTTAERSSFAGGRYEVRRILGEGGQKTVYLVFDSALGREAALSLLRAHHVSPEELLRLRREAQAMARIGNHPNIVTVYDLGVEDERPYIVSEYLPGGDLRQALDAAGGPFPLARILAVARDVCHGLAFAHDHGLIHRDLKPANVWLNENGTAKLGDFGLALSVDRARLTMPGTVLGTPAYVAPEQAQGHPVDARTDLYALGCLLYELLTGEPPFGADSALGVVSQHVHAEPEPPSRRDPRVPPDLDALVLRLLAKSPERRPATARDVLDELMRARGEVAESTTAAFGTRPETLYARSSNVNIAYQVLGDGPIDLVFVMGWVSHLEYFWEEPHFARFLRRLASFSRLILFDKRGTGLSDRVPTDSLPGLEQRMDDVRAVMDAVGSERAALCGVSEGGPMCALFAASYPERTHALVMIGTYAKRIWAPDYPWAPTPEERQHFFEEIERSWGGPVGISARAPTLAQDQRFRAWWASYLRMGASPGAVLALTRMNAEIDVRPILPSIRVPTLLLHRTGDRCIRVEESRYMAERIPGAHLVELPGDDHLPFVGGDDAILEEMERFLAGVQPQEERDRVLVTVLFVLPSAPGGRLPEDARRSYESLLRLETARHRGREGKVAGGLAPLVFDGPARAIRCGQALLAASRRLGVLLRAGVHTGECDLIGDRLEGFALSVAAAVVSRAAPGEVLVTSTVRDLVAGSGLRFEDRGVHPLGGVVGEWRLHAASEAPPPLRS